MKKNNLTNVLLILAVVAMMFNAQPALAEKPAGIDLLTDVDGNQISDAVEVEVALIESLPVNQQGAEIQKFVSNLNISKQSQALQLRSQKLTTSLATATPNQAQTILKELAAISEQLKSDPVIAKAESDIRVLTEKPGQNLNTQQVDVFAQFDDASAEANSSVLTGPVVSGFSWKKGDVLAIRSSGKGWSWLWTMTYAHTGNWYDASRVYESNPDGVRLKPLSNWQASKAYIGIARNNKQISTTISNSVNWAYSKYGDNGKTPYNTTFIDKWTDKKLYCSQLTWKINKYAGSDVDSNAWQYQLWAAIVYGSWIINGLLIPAVAPDEVMLSGNLTVLRTGYNP